VDSCKFTPFGLCVKTELLKRGKTQKWLEEEITNPDGTFCGQRIHGQDSEGEAQCSEGCTGHSGNPEFTK